MADRAKLAAGVIGSVILAAAAYFTPSPQGVELIKKSEGLELQAYPDAVQIPTICYGSTRGVKLGMSATLAECEERLVKDATYAGRALDRYVEVKISQRQYDALVSFVYNIGETQFRKSTLLKKLNSGECKAAAKEFDRWVYAKGKKLRGLVKRRADERNIFETDCVFWEATVRYDLSYHIDNLAQVAPRV